MNNEQKNAILTAIGGLIDAVSGAIASAPGAAQTTTPMAPTTQAPATPAVPVPPTPTQGLAGMVGQTPLQNPAQTPPPLGGQNVAMNPPSVNTAPPQDTAPFVLTPKVVSDRLTETYISNLVNRNYIPKLADTTALAGDIGLKISELITANFESFVDMSGGVPVDSTRMIMNAQVTNDFFRTNNHELTAVTQNNHGHLLGQQV